MRKTVVLLSMWVGVTIHAEEKIVRGTVTYMASSTVYTSLGGEAGVRDSTLLYVMSNRDTTATLKVFAVSSKTSACWIVKSSRLVNVGDDIVGRVQVAEERRRDADTARVSTTIISASDVAGKKRRVSAPRQEEFLNVQGRISAQYYTSLYDNSAFNIAQPGIVINLRGTTRDAPLKFDVYANLRTLSVGGESPFSRGAINQSRIYGISIGYDDGEYAATVGRIIPTFLPSVGYIDGVVLSKRFGGFALGTSLGYQPKFDLRGASTEYKKLALFAQYLSPDRHSLSVSAAYARMYYHSSLDREVASILLNAAIVPELYLYANSEVDLRRKSGDDFILSPLLTSLYVNLNYRITNSLSMGLGADASRPYYSFEMVRLVPDSLLVNHLRSGVSVNVNILFPGGIMLYNTYTPRNADNGSFGSEYSNSSSLSLSNILSTGINVRSTYALNANQYTKTNGYGFSVQRTFERLFDLNVRYQRNAYTIKQLESRNHSTTFGGDIMVFLSKSVTFLATFDRLEGYGTKSNSVFAEISVRF